MADVEGGAPTVPQTTSMALWIGQLTRVWSSFSDRVRRFVSSPPQVFTLSGCITIEQGANRNGFLEVTQNAYPHTGRHNSTEEALGNLKPCTQGERVIVGHGRPGMILTSNGDQVGNVGERITITTDLSGLKGVGTLRLVSCNTAEGAVGEQFLKKIAAAIEGTVIASTGLVHYGIPSKGQEGLYLDSNARWRSATFKREPDPYEPVPPFRSDSVAVLRLRNGEGIISIEASQVELIQLIPAGEQEKLTTLTWHGDRAEQVLRFLDLGNEQYPGPPAAIVTGTITLTFKPGSALQRPRSLLVYNDQILMDLEYNDVYYKANVADLRTVPALR